MNTDSVRRIFSEGPRFDDFISIVRKFQALFMSTVVSGSLHWCSGAPFGEVQSRRQFDSLLPDVRRRLCASLGHALPWTMPESIFPIGFDQLRFGTESPLDPQAPEDIEGWVDESIGEAFETIFGPGQAHARNVSRRSRPFTTTGPSTGQQTACGTVWGTSSTKLCLQPINGSLSTAG